MATEPNYNPTKGRKTAERVLACWRMFGKPYSLTSNTNHRDNECRLLLPIPRDVAALEAGTVGFSVPSLRTVFDQWAPDLYLMRVSTDFDHTRNIHVLLVDVKLSSDAAKASMRALHAEARRKKQQASNAS